MRRRTVLARAALALPGVAATAGCTADALEEAERPPPPLSGLGPEDVDLPYDQPLEVAAAGVAEAVAAGIDSPAALVAYLDDVGLAVADPTVEDEALLALSYAAPPTRDRGLVHHLGHVAGGYAALVDAGRDYRRLEATVLGSTGEPFGTYEIRRAWAEAYLDGETTAREYAAEVGTTAESV